MTITTLIVCLRGPAPLSFHLREERRVAATLLSGYTIGLRFKFGSDILRGKIRLVQCETLDLDRMQ